ncbi:MAG: glutathione S-transferase N-terminal domain-containing protein [SAR324 cluster bacterium]|nr:glutathione S-transferase N-terminal domain-containing protein [SAR324 cluster bacterium]
MDALEALDVLIQKFGSQTNVINLLGYKKGTPLRKDGKIISPQIEADILRVWENECGKTIIKAKPKPVKGAKKQAPGDRTIKSTGVEHFISAVIAPPKIVTPPPVLYHSTLNPVSQKLKQILDRNHFSYELVSLKQDSDVAVTIKNLFGRLKTPVLQHGEHWVGDPGEILDYLRQTFPGSLEMTPMEQMIESVLYPSKLLKNFRLKK